MSHRIRPFLFVSVLLATAACGDDGGRQVRWYRGFRAGRPQQAAAAAGAGHVLA